MDLPVMTFDAFCASARAMTQEEWETVRDYIPEIARESITAFAEGFVIHELDGKFYPHAWWYSPVAHDTKESALRNLFDWRLEFVVDSIS